MARNRYAKDYRLVGSMDDRGRIRNDVEYAGAHYTFLHGLDTALRTGERALVSCIIAWISLIGAMIPNTELMRTIWIALPLVFCLLPLTFLTGSAFTAARIRYPLEHRHADRFDNRWPANAFLLMVLSAAALIGAIINVVQIGCDGGHIVFLLGTSIVFIARALALSPDFIVCDEPVSALDVSIQAQIINLLKQLQRDFGLTYLFISHDLSVVEHISDTVGVMYLGSMVEYAATEKIFANPLNPYTKALFSAIPIPDPDAKINRIILQGSIPSPANPPSGCKFHTRCDHCQEVCEYAAPEWLEVEEGHYCACHLYDDDNARARAQEIMKSIKLTGSDKDALKEVG